MTKILREGADSADRESSRTASSAVSHAAHFEVERVPLIQPLPWVAVCDGHDGRIYDANGLIVVTALTPDEADLIVRACNSHDALLAALKALVDNDEIDLMLGGNPNVTDRAVALARAAIAKAEGN